MTQTEEAQIVAQEVAIEKARIKRLKSLSCVEEIRRRTLNESMCPGNFIVSFSKSSTRDNTYILIFADATQANVTKDTLEKLHENNLLNRAKYE